MSREVDERIVEMRFDHKQFKSGAQETLSMLDKLKQALDLPGAAKGFEQIDKAAKGVSLEGIAASVDALANRFSTLGIVGMRVISNLTDSIMGKLNQAIGFVSNAIVSGGIRRAMNLENAHFQLQALLKDEEKVQAIMKDANDAVTGTAYSYDEAAKAASQFAASGVQAGDQMLGALKAIVGVTAMTNSEFEGVAQIFTNVAGNGRLMGDQLLQLSSRGLNAAATIADFINGVNDGTKETTENVKASVRALSNGMKVTEGDIREFVSKGKISFDIFSESMKEAFADSAERANETFTGAFSNMKAALARIGAGFISPLVEQNSAVVDLFNALRVRINDVKSALVFDEQLKNTDALSKQFTDSVLQISKSATEFLNNLDLTDAMELFYYGLEIVKDSAKGLFSILRPIGNAFSEVFSTVTGRNIIDLASGIRDFTSKLKLSERGAEGLQKAFKGVFSVGKLLVDIFIKLVAFIVPVQEPVGSLADVLLTLAGAIGDALTKFTEWIRSSDRIRRAYDVVGDVIRNIMADLTQFINKFYKLYQAISDTGIVQKAIKNIKDGLVSLLDFIEPYLVNLPKDFENFKKAIKDLLPKDIDFSVESFTKSLDSLSKVFKDIDFTKPSEMFNKVSTAIQDLIGGKIGGNFEGFGAFVESMKKYAKDLVSNFDLSKLTETAGDTEWTLSKFTDFMKEKFLAVFGEGFNLSSITSTASGVGVIYAMIEGIKALNKFTATISDVNPIPDLMKSIKKTLESYQKDLNASALMKTAVAIGILAGALTLLSFVDPERLLAAALGLSMAAGVLLFGTAKLMEALKKTKTIEDVASQLVGVLKGLTKAIKIKALGSAVKDFAISIAIIAVSLIGLGIMYSKDKDSLENAAKLVGEIAIVLLGVMAGMTIISGIFKSGSKNFMKSAAGIALIAAAVGTIVNALKTLFKMEFPSDWEQKVGLLGGILLSLAGLVTVLGIASRLAKGGSIKAQSITAMAAGLYIMLMTLNSLFKMEIPNDYAEKLFIFGGILTGLAGLMIAMGVAGKLSGGAIKAAGTILAMCVFVGVITAALMVLSLIDGDKLVQGATALGIVLMSLAVALAGASKIADKSAANAVKAMAITVAAITASLAALTLFSFASLFKSAVILGSILITLATDFRAVSQITNEKVWIVVLEMVAMVGTIAVSLMALATKPWENILAAAVSMGLVMLSLSKTMNSISNAGGIDLTKIGTFALCVAALVPISLVLKELAEQPWENLLAAGTSLTEVLVSMGITMKLCTSAGTMAQAALIGIGLLDLFIANFALVLMALGALWNLDGFRKLINDGGEALLKIGGAIGGFVGGILGGVLSGVSSALPKIGENMAKFMENMSPFIDQCRGIDGDVLKGVGFLAAAIVVITAAEVISGIGYFLGGGVGLLNLAETMSVFIEKLEPFIKAVEQLDEGTVEACLYLSEMIILLTAADILQGIKSFFGGGKTSLASFGEELAKFGPYIVKFAKDVEGVDPDSVKGAAAAAEIMAEVATKLPSVGGLKAKIFGEKSLAEFGKELVVFGPYIKLFAVQVKDVNPEAVQGAASAASIMSELANNLPSSGGLKAKIFGTKSLAEFGAELLAFGPSIRTFSSLVKDVNPAAVEGVKATTDILTTMANGLPDSETLWQKIFGGGKVTLSDFGVELISYAEKMASISTTLSPVNIDLIEQSTEAFKHLINLADFVDGKSADGIIQFTNELSGVAFDVIDKFADAFIGSESTIGKAVGRMIEYANNAISDGETTLSNSSKRWGSVLITGMIDGMTNKKMSLNSTVSDITDKVKDTVQLRLTKTDFMNIGQDIIQGLANGMNIKKAGVVNTAKTITNDISTAFKSVLTTTAFNSIGQDIMNALNTSLNGKRSTVVTTAKTIANDILTSTKSILTITAFNSTGQNLLQGLINGMNSKKEGVTSSAKAIANGVLSAINGIFVPAQFQAKGASIIQSLQTGMQNQTGSAVNASKNMANNIVDAFRSIITPDQFRSIGANAAQGLANGIESKIGEIRDAAISAARAAIEAARRELEEHSPSKVFEEMGEYADEGLANGMIEMADTISNAAKKAANRINKPITKEIGNIFDDIGYVDNNFAIHPVVDLSDVKRAANETSDMFKNAIDLSAAKNIVDSASASYNQSKASREREASSNNSSRNVEINMEQNNYSPKALSRTDIYRDTENLFSTLKGKVVSLW